MSDIGHTFTLAKQHALMLNNLYQIDDGTFRANWRREGKEKFFSQVISGWGAAAVLAESLDIAIKMAPALKDDAVLAPAVAAGEAAAAVEAVEDDMFA